MSPRLTRLGSGGRLGAALLCVAVGLSVAAPVAAADPSRSDSDSGDGEFGPLEGRVGRVVLADGDSVVLLGSGRPLVNRRVGLWLEGDGLAGVDVVGGLVEWRIESEPGESTPVVSDSIGVGSEGSPVVQFEPTGSGVWRVEVEVDGALVFSGSFLVDEFRSVSVDPSAGDGAVDGGSVDGGSAGRELVDREEAPVEGGELGDAALLEWLTGADGAALSGGLAVPRGRRRWPSEAPRVMRRLSSLGGWSHDRATTAG